MQIWDREKLSIYSNISARDATYLEWSPDGRHIATATLFPRLRVDNGYKLWSIDGTVVDQALVTELYQLTFKPQVLAATSLPPPPSKAQKANGEGSTAGQAAPKRAAYVPPHLRNQAQTHSAPRALHELVDDSVVGYSSLPVGSDPTAGSSSLKKNKEKEKEKEDSKEKKGKGKGKEAATPLDKEELEKKIKAATKKLKDVQALKEQQQAGKTLEKNQLDKVSKEATFQKELDELTSALAQLS